MTPLFLFVAVACGSTSRPGSTPPDLDGGTDDGSVTPDGTVGPDGAVTPDGATASVVVTDENITVSGKKREFVLALPGDYDSSRAYPLVLVLHGDGGDGPGMRKFFTFDAASGNEAIVAYPSGLNSSWDLYTALDQNDDQGFLVALVTSLKGRFNVDGARVFGVGYSSGGFEINQLACRKPGFFKGINVYAGGAPDEPDVQPPLQFSNGYVKCPGEVGLAALVVHGTSDHTVDPGSGDFDATYWAYVNGCSDSRSSTTPSPCEKHDGCPADKPVLFCLIQGLGHVPWPDGAKAAWPFFKAL